MNVYQTIKDQWSSNLSSTTETLPLDKHTLISKAKKGDQSLLDFLFKREEFRNKFFLQTSCTEGEKVDYIFNQNLFTHFINRRG